MIIFLLSTLVMAPSVPAAAAPAPSSDKTASSGESASQGELAQSLATIALYPDPLLAQMFMAATYPLEIVEAAVFQMPLFLALAILWCILRGIVFASNNPAF